MDYAEGQDEIAQFVNAPSVLKMLNDGITFFFTIAIVAALLGYGGSAGSTAGSAGSTAGIAQTLFGVM